jgi:hypothetical protein
MPVCGRSSPLQRTVSDVLGAETALVNVRTEWAGTADPGRWVLQLLDEDLHVFLDQRGCVRDPVARSGRDPQSAAAADRPLMPVMAFEEVKQSIRDDVSGHAATASNREISRSSSRPAREGSTHSTTLGLLMFRTYGRTTRASGRTG